MNELIKAAKAVIEKWDLIKPDQVPAYIKELHAAVERAERQEAVGFGEWFENQSKYPTFEQTWTAAQQAERERIKDLFRQSSDWFEDDQMAQAKWLMEKIDSDED